MSFTDKVVLVTGAGSGIGAATAIAFSKEGASVAMIDKDEAGLNNVTEKYGLEGPKILLVKADISIENEVKKIIEKVINAFKKLDVLVNCAGVLYFSNIFDADLMKTYDKIMNVNLRGTIQLTQVAVPYLIESKGNIINISSCIASSVPGQISFLTYGISKAGLNYFSLDLAKELGPLGVRVNIISPGPCRTNVNAHLGRDDWLEKMEAASALRRVSEPEEIADVVLFIAKAKGIHGSNYGYDNGFQII